MVRGNTRRDSDPGRLTARCGVGDANPESRPANRTYTLSDPWTQQAYSGCADSHVSLYGLDIYIDLAPKVHRDFHRHSDARRKRPSYVPIFCRILYTDAG
jgi:hypothetical protein